MAGTESASKEQLSLAITKYQKGQKSTPAIIATETTELPCLTKSKAKNQEPRQACDLCQQSTLEAEAEEVAQGQSQLVYT